MRFRDLVALAVIAAALAGCTRQRPPGVLAPDTPEQDNLESARPIPHHGVALVPLARFAVTARVLSAQRYWTGRSARLVPVDLALGWGRMSDSAVLDGIQVSQMGRAYFWHTNEPPIPVEEIESHSANMHLIPSTPEVERTIERARPGDVIEIRGALVEAHAPDGWVWTSSMTREDTGDGACELVWVEEARLR